MFIQYNENPRDNFRAGDCVVRAISVVPTDPAGTVEPISLAIAINGETDPSSIMTVTVPLVSDTAGDNVGSSIIVAIPSICGCQSVSVRNISTQAINVMNANILFNYIGYRRVR